MNAGHDAEARYPQPNCHPNTRVDALNRLDRWIRDESGTPRVCWIHGSAGVGKSAIAQKVSEDHPDQLCGAFFFSRNDSSRDKLYSFIATLAYQCCTSVPLGNIVGPFIIDAIRSHPNIFQTSVENQFRKLLLEPFSKVTQPQQQKLPNLIVVDGLDECIDPSSQRRLLSIIDEAIMADTPNTFPFIFLLCSRPEPQICHGIDGAGFTSALQRIEISGTTIRFTGKLTDSDLDIQRYFVEKFAMLREKHRTVLQDEGAVWPSQGAVQDLVWRASGQFIFAVTVINYIDTLDERPQDRLDTILCTEPGDILEPPYSALDALYRQILSTCRHWDKVRPILRLLVTLHPDIEDLLNIERKKIEWSSTSIITRLLGLRPGDVEVLLSKLHSVIYIPENADWEIRILHTSFTEFLQDRARSMDFFSPQYSREDYCDMVAVLLLRTLSPYCSSTPSLNDPSSAYGVEDLYNHNLFFRFASDYWSAYCCQVPSPSVDLLAVLDELDPYASGALTFAKGHNHGVAWALCGWRNCLKWAKVRPGGKVPRKFIEKTEAFFQGFYIAYYTPQPFSRLNLILHTLRVEYGFSSLDGCDEDLSVTVFPLRYYIRWSGEEWSDRAMYFLVLPTTSKAGLVVPDGWTLVHITKANENILQRMYDIYVSLDQRAREIFNNDILHDATESVTQNLVKDRDLAKFKAQLYKHRNLLTKSTTTHLNTSILQDDASSGGDVSIFPNDIASIRDTASLNEVDPASLDAKPAASPLNVASFNNGSATMKEAFLPDGILEKSLRILKTIVLLLLSSVVARIGSQLVSPNPSRQESISSASNLQEFTDVPD
ncbi:hypothetical protein VNI00_008800 [Paramarasmius palmivorus]|uniref:Nephrocystin 3-like N-terminal domain-containing protein n=1 Tax=Paramarasmius palmivorus TaxID=297713 RepID=A0AAW0CW30_9AGAR